MPPPQRSFAERVDTWIKEGGIDDARGAGALVQILLELLNYFFWPVVWIITIGSAVAAAFLTARRVRDDRIEYRLRNRICLHCGYDCRASEGRCPECGNSLAGKLAADPSGDVPSNDPNLTKTLTERNAAAGGSRRHRVPFRATD